MKGRKFKRAKEGKLLNGTKKELKQNRELKENLQKKKNV